MNFESGTSKDSLIENMSFRAHSNFGNKVKRANVELWSVSIRRAEIEETKTCWLFSFEFVLHVSLCF